MTRGRPRAVISLTSQEHAALARLVEEGDADLARRARVVLLSSEGVANNAIAARLGINESTVGKWRRRFIAERVIGITASAPPAADSAEALPDEREADPRWVPTGVLDNALVSRRRAAIVAAALELFRKKGYGATSVGEIAAAAGLPIATLYRYISKKSDILYLLTLDLTPNLIDAIQEALSGEGATAERLRRGIRGYLYAIAQRRTHIKIMYWDTHWLEPEEQEVIKAEEIRTRRLFEEVLERGCREGVLRPVNTLVAAQNIILAGHAWAIKGFVFKGVLDLDEYVDAQVDVLMAGLLVAGDNRRVNTRRHRD